jgi:hypothetical protein
VLSMPISRPLEPQRSETQHCPEFPQKSKNFIEMSGKCAVCLAEAQQQCAGCKNVFYCGKSHQKSHWKSHKDECRPVKVLMDPVLGRHLVATRDIAQGELVLRELPLVTGKNALVMAFGVVCCSFL